MRSTPGRCSRSVPAKSLKLHREFDATRTPSQSALPSAAAGAGEPRTAFFFIDNADVGQAVRTRLFDALGTSVVDMMSGGVGVVFLLWSDELLLIKPPGGVCGSPPRAHEP